MANTNNNSTDDFSEYISIMKNKAIIKSVDMAEEMKINAIDCAISAMEKYNVEKDIAAYIKNEVEKTFLFDKKFGTTWHCIVGRNFGSYVTHGKFSGHYINYVYYY
ncbi:hypothetical protein PCK2_000174 [Pneumocystis canis]|nr:hypothetical protein PCK2_000174 [Pneumocystis canis]